MSDNILYTKEDRLTKINVQIEYETLCLSNKKMAIFFDKALIISTDYVFSTSEIGNIIKKVVCHYIRLTTSLMAIEEFKFRMVDYLQQLDNSDETEQTQNTEK